MNDLISRQAAIKALSFDKELLNRALDDMDMVGIDREKYTWGLGLVESYIADIEDLPTAQPERKTGKWVFEDGSPINRGLKMMETAVCSQCGHIAPGYSFWDCDLELTNFCPNCGAEMKGENDD